MLSVRTKIIMLAVIVFGAIMLTTLNYTSLLKLEAVTVNAAPVDSFSERYGLNDQKSILRQPLENLADNLLEERNIYKVDIKYNLPGTIDIKLNNFNPVCFVLDKNSGNLHGLNSEGRLIPLKDADFSWDNPVLTTVTTNNMFEHCQDFRICEVIRQLIQLKKKNNDLYRLIDEIDFGNISFVKVSIDGLPYRLKINSHTLLKDLNRFVDFVSRFQPNLEETQLLDFRYDDMIVSSKGKK